MKKILVCMSAIVFTAASSAASAEPRLTGQQLLERWKPGVSSFELGANELLDRNFADGYVAGVVDATRGLLWCAPTSLKGVEVDGDVMWSLKALTKDERKGAAAERLISLLSQRFPCKGKADKR
jgi:hypothetical protein